MIGTVIEMIATAILKKKKLGLKPLVSVTRVQGLKHCVQTVLLCEEILCSGRSGLTPGTLYGDLNQE